MSGSLPRWATTKIHALVEKKGRPIKLKLTTGQESDFVGAPELIADLPQRASPTKATTPARCARRC